MYPFPNNVDDVSNFTACTNDNMNAVLINTLLSLILMAFKLLCKQEGMLDPNTVF
jgi:hypothetical protein